MTETYFHSSLAILAVIQSFCSKLFFWREFLFFPQFQFYGDLFFSPLSLPVCLNHFIGLVVHCRTGTSLCTFSFIFATSYGAVASFVTYALFLFGCCSSFTPFTSHVTSHWVAYKRFFCHKFWLNTRQKHSSSCPLIIFNFHIFSFKMLRLKRLSIHTSYILFIWVTVKVIQTSYYA